VAYADQVKQDGEVALLDATETNVSNSDDCPPYSPFHFLRAHDDNGVPVSQLHFHWCYSSDKGGRQLHLAIVSGSLLRVATMSTFEIFYAYHASSSICDIRFCPYGPERILVANDSGITENVPWKPWQFIYGENSFHNLHSRFQPNIPSTLKIVDEPQQQLIKLNLLVFFIAL
jgi:hypothetical protein